MYTIEDDRRYIEENLKTRQKAFFDYGMCKKCGGHCCIKNACDCHPYDFDYSVENMRKALQTGNYSIDFARESAYPFKRTKKGITLDLEYILECYEEAALYIRPRHVNRPIVDIIHDEAPEDPCSLWSAENGCKLKEEERPLFGRTVMPAFDGKYVFCEDYWSKGFFISAWLRDNFQEELFKLATELFDPENQVHKELNFYL